METISMTTNELETVRIFERLDRREISQANATKLLHLKSTRQVKRKLKAFRRDGPKSLIHGLRSRPGNRQMPQEIKDQAVKLVTKFYHDFKPSFAAEKLLENHDIKIGKETLRLLMTKAGLWTPKHLKQAEAHIWRERKECKGELVQLDGSIHAWFEDRGEKCCLLAFIDDATSEPLWLEFATGESTEAVMRAAYNYVKKEGIPVAFYTDRGGVYKVNLNNEENNRITQYERALEELGSEAIHARSPQAKGRVERLFGTLQDRLVKELRLRGISNIEDGNRYLREEYLKIHTDKFAVPAKSSTNLHKSIEGYDLNRIFSIKSERVLTSDLCISYHKKWLQLAKKQPKYLSKKERIEVREGLDGSIQLWLRGSELLFTELTQRQVKPQAIPPIITHTLITKPTKRSGSRAFLFAP